MGLIRQFRRCLNKPTPGNLEKYFMKSVEARLRAEIQIGEPRDTLQRLLVVLQPDENAFPDDERATIEKARILCQSEQPKT